jgi:integrin alpha FG-GAP repeat containing protein 1
MIHSSVVIFSALLAFFQLISCYSEQSIGLPGSAAIIAYADINSDKYTDLITLTNNNQLNVYNYIDETHFELNKNINIQLPADSLIINVAATDFNRDAKVDLLVQYKLNANSNSKYLQNCIYLGELDHLRMDHVISLDGSIDQLLLYDSNNDLWPDLYGMNNITGTRTIWRNNKLTDTDELTFTAIYLPADSFGFTQLAVPTSNSFVDIDGDCLADLFLVSYNPATQKKRMEIWLNTGSNEDFAFQLPQSHQMPAYSTATENLGLTYWFDFDSDGTMDLLFTKCAQNSKAECEKSELHVIFNKQKPMCGNIWDKSGDSCRAQQDLCSKDPNFSIDFISTTASEYHAIFTEFFGYQLYNPPTSEISPYNPPLTIHAGDSNLDGFIDLLIPVRSTSDDGISLKLFTNTECSTDNYNICTRRNIALDDSISVPNGLVGSFIDIGNTGKLSILASQINNNNELNTLAYINSDVDDSYFLTVLTSNGLCSAWCSEGPQFPDPKPYGTNQVGVAIKFTLTNLQGVKHSISSMQLTQSSSYSLQLPYAFFGLGRTNNYIEELFVGIPYKSSVDSTNYQIWVAIIPNSQLVIFPYPPDSPADWVLELFISPTRSLWAVVTSLVVCLILNAAIIAYLHYREKQQDQREKQKNELLFTF